MASSLSSTAFKEEFAKQTRADKRAAKDQKKKARRVLALIKKEKLLAKLKGEIQAGEEARKAALDKKTAHVPSLKRQASSSRPSRSEGVQKVHYEPEIIDLQEQTRRKDVAAATYAVKEIIKNSTRGHPRSFYITLRKLFKSEKYSNNKRAHMSRMRRLAKLKPNTKGAPRIGREKISKGGQRPRPPRTPIHKWTHQPRCEKQRDLFGGVSIAEIIEIISEFKVFSTFSNFHKLRATNTNLQKNTHFLARAHCTGGNALRWAQRLGRAARGAAGGTAKG